jgi:hypothetical protein
MEHNLNDVIDDLRRRTKVGELPRETRMVEIERITEWWFRETGAMPDAKQLDKLADLVLYEELTDNNEHKVSQNEYPILSERQFERRDNREVKSAGDMEGNAVDGRNHMPPTRRKRSDYENRLVDKKTKTRNEERKRRYKEFTKVQPVEVRRISEL